ncbi:arsenate reductase (glutaredoxin) [Pantoea sp. MBD-2R]|uniref:arsenate reductase (glutaredoxin) n=1 Tax=unclassified Pantoea TaxID=2630326 RepID=UPI0011BE3808|nr:arsenate reductase (glutaredoxin) [Pantoea sp. CCBC3-3-1]
MSDILIYHNPRCSKSRETLQLLQAQGITPEIVLYLEDPPPVSTLKTLLAKLEFTTARELMRQQEDVYKQLNLDDETLSEEQLLQIMADNPKLIERPIVIAYGRARLGRPPAQVLEILTTAKAY